MPKYTVLELTENEARVLHASKTPKSPLKVEHAFAIDFSDLPKEDSSAAKGGRLRDALRDRKIVDPGQVGLVIPKQTSIVRTALLPSADPAELASMAQFEAEKFIPFNADRHIISHGVLRTDEVHGSHILITAVDGPVMEAALAICTEALLRPAMAEISSVALARAYALQAAPTALNASTVLLNIGRSQMEITLMNDGLVMAARSQSLGTDKLLKEIQEAMHLETAPQLARLAGLDIQNPDGFLLEGGVSKNTESSSGVATTAVGDKVRGWLTRVSRFVGQTVEFGAREQNIPTPVLVVLSGEATRLTGIAGALQGLLRIEVQTFDPLSKMSPQGTPDPSLVAGFATATGALSRLVEEEENPKARIGRPNLLPPAVIEKQQSEARRTLLMISGALVFIAAVMLYFAWDLRQTHLQTLEELYKDYNREMRPIVAEIREKEDRLDIIRSIKSDRASAMVLLDQISTFASIGPTTAEGRLTLTGYRFSVDDTVTISGMALEIEDINKFSDFLEKLTYKNRPIFKDLGIPDQRPTPLGGERGTVYSFTIAGVLDANQPDEKQDSEATTNDE